jgi:hypothetical protein
VKRPVPAARFFAWLVSAWLALLVSMSGVARADDSGATAPDVPVVANGARVVLPPLPASYEIQHLGWWSIAYPAALRDRVRPLIDKADGWKADLTTDFGQDVLTQPVEIRVARTWDEMTTLVPRELGVLPYAAGETYLPYRFVLLSVTEPESGDATDLETVLHHELSHVALFDATGGRHVPLWFNEGLAVYESGEHPVLRMKELWDATLFRQLLPLADLDRRFPERQDQVNIAYAESADVLRFLLHGKDRLRFVNLLEKVRRGSSFDVALGDAYGTDMRRLEYQWREACAKRNTFAPMLASGSFVWVFAFAAMVVGYRRKRREAQATLARWEKEELAEASAAAVEDDATLTDPSRAHAGLPKIEHDGGWHTLH